MILDLIGKAPSMIVVFSRVIVIFLARPKSPRPKFSSLSPTPSEINLPL